MKISFFIQTENSPAAIYVRFSDGRRLDLKAKTGLVIDPKFWSAQKAKPRKQKAKPGNQKAKPAKQKWTPGMPKTGLSDAKEKNECNSITGHLKIIDKDLTIAYNETKNKLEIDKDWLNRYFRPVQDDNAIPTALVPYFEYYHEAKRHELKKPSLVKLNVVKHLLQRMEQTLKCTFQIADVNEDFKAKYLQFSKANNYSPNTIARNLRFIKTICYHAESNGIALSPRLKKISLSNTVVDKIYLTPEDITLIEKAKFTEEHLEHAKDWLLISCETGQRVSDFLRFTKDMIRIEAGKNLIEFTQKKTGTIMTVPLSKRVLGILKKRKGEFPRKMSDQRYNEHIKTVCEYAGITYKIKGSIQDESGRKITGTFPKFQLVTSHIGRRSFATNNYGRIPTSLLIAATGHSTEKMFLEYIGKSDTQKALALADYF